MTTQGEGGPTTPPTSSPSDETPGPATGLARPAEGPAGAGDPEPAICDVDVLQRDQAAWADAKFGPERKTYAVGGIFQVLAMAKSLGRVAHHHLKHEQGIRGDAAHHGRGAAEALGDLDRAASLYAWARRPCTPTPYEGAGLKPVLGVIEECGELAAAALRRELALRDGSPAEAEAQAAEMRDAVADIIIYLCDVCSRNGWRLGGLLLRTAAAVFRRDPAALPPTRE